LSTLHQTGIHIIGIIFCLTVIQPLYAAGKDTALSGLEGEDMRLSDYIGKGKWVLFNVWGPKCPPCIEEVSELTSFHDDHEDSDAIVVSLALDFPSFGYAKADQVAAFVDDYFVNFPVMLGDSVLSEKITGKRLLGMPTTYLYAPDGTLATVRIGTIT